MPNSFRLRRRDFLKGAASVGALAGVTAVNLYEIAALAAPTPREIPYRTGDWSTDPFDPRGNHRVVVRVIGVSDVVWVHLPWRRHDGDPAKKGILIMHAGTGEAIKNVVRLDIRQEYGELAFHPKLGPGEYYIYYLPFDGPGRSKNYPVITYPPPVSIADAAWVTRNRLSSAERKSEHRRRFPQARVVEFQSVDTFNSFFPMGIIAGSNETDALVRAHASPVLLFPEDRSRSIRMTGDLPHLWSERGIGKAFQGNARQDEFYAIQIGVYSARQSIENLKVSCDDLRASSGAKIPASAWTCFNTGGVDWRGEAFTHAVSMEQGRVQPLWLGVQIPKAAAPGHYRGTIAVSADGVASVPVRVDFDVTAPSIADHGDGDPDRLSRLRWLNSRLAEDDSIVPPFEPMTLQERMVGILGRSVVVGPDGLPERIQSRFAPSNTELTNDTKDILRAPISLVVESFEAMQWKPGELRFEPYLPGRVQWSVTNTAGPMTMQLLARMEFDGHIAFTVAISSRETIDVQDIRLEVPYTRDASVYMMGLGQKGGYRPSRFHWQWDVQKNQDAVWVGDVNAGMQVSLRDERYSRPLNTNFYHLKPLVMPASWCNDGHGGCSLTEPDAETTLLRCYSGPRTMHPGETLYYNFNLLLTPFKLVDTRAHWHARYFHKSDPPAAEVKATGANVINIHHGTSINPYLNYPFLRPKEMKDYIDEAHSLGMKVKIYYTVRELSHHASEIFALRSLGHEIFVPGPGGGYSWLQEQLGSDYIAGWCVPSVHDATVINSGASRWHNYYVEGVRYLAKHIGIDGLYLDDLAFDRSIMQRVRRVLDQNRPGALIDLHSANQYDERDGFASSANLYMGELPYIDRLWFGEYFDYNAAPDYYLLEISGIPFGLMGEMLQGGGNPWRGMVYGMTTRMGASGDPRPLWKLWDEYGIEESRMEGYWSPSNPIRTGSKEILATSYVRKDTVLIAIASWAPQTSSVRLEVDWAALGQDPAQASLTAPAIEAFQPAANYRLTDEIPVPAGRGMLLILTSAKKA